MGFKTIEYYYTDSPENAYKSIDDKEIKCPVFYYGINKDQSLLPVVRDNMEAKHYEIPLYLTERYGKIVVSIVADIFTEPGGRLIQYKKLDLNIYSNNGEYAITQATYDHIFIIGTNKHEKKMTVTVVDKEYNIHNMEFYYFGHPLDFDIELISYQINEKDYIKTELGENNRVHKMYLKKRKKELTRTTTYKGTQFKDIRTVPIIVVENNSILVLNNPEDPQYFTTYEYTKRNNKEYLHRKYTNNYTR